MSSAAPQPASDQRDVPSLLARLIDDAALFPPGNATVPDAVRLHLAGRSGPHADLVGLFLCPASRLPELITELIKVKPAKPVELSLVIDTGLGGVPKALSIVESRAELLALRMVEMPAPTDVDEVWLERVSEFVPEDVIRVIEPRRGGAGWLDGIQRVIEHGSWPKLRCGGLSAENFPAVDQVAEFLGVINSGGASFKATAGLHNAVRHTAADTGFTHHGFLNLLIATGRLLAGADAEHVRAALESTDGTALAEEAQNMTEHEALSVRGVFASYGSCSLTDPVADLEGLGLL
ncbi:hypothetical protein [Actinophytocola algeriensis]|uniref:hypothetical protein n=1 Tax=Actinophytocola algeriensis TaxID=1768010 RepID=UPI002892BF8B|nr:hypothetical protein [Actinophytocola algeriensis]